MRGFSIFLSTLDTAIVAYALASLVIKLIYVFGRLRHIGGELLAEHVRPAMAHENDRFLPHITLLVPAYNEEVTICESMRSLLRLRYPSFEIVVCNDGSKDRTLEQLLGAFHFMPIELEYDDQLGTAPVRRFYEMRAP